MTREAKEKSEEAAINYKERIFANAVANGNIEMFITIFPEHDHSEEIDDFSDDFVVPTEDDINKIFANPEAIFNQPVEKNQRQLPVFDPLVTTTVEH